MSVDGDGVVSHNPPITPSVLLLGCSVKLTSQVPKIKLSIPNTRSPSLTPEPSSHGDAVCPFAACLCRWQRKGREADLESMADLQNMSEGEDEQSDGEGENDGAKEYEEDEEEDEMADEAFESDSEDGDFAGPSKAKVKVKPGTYPQQQDCTSLQKGYTCIVPRASTRNANA